MIMITTDIVEKSGVVMEPSETREFDLRQYVI